MKYVKTLSVICGISLFAALLSWPIGYYDFLRLLVFVGAMCIVFTGINAKQRFWPIAFLLTALLYNPIFPVYLYEKARWMPFNLAGGFLFMWWAGARKWN